MYARLSFLGLVVTLSAVAGTISSGTMVSDLNGGTSSYSLNLGGTTNNGNPFSISLGKPGAGTPYLGNKRCPDVGGVPVSVNCTWDFQGPSLLDINDAFTAFNGQSVLWNGTTYGFAPGTVYSLHMDFTITTAPVTVASSVFRGVHTWTFPLNTAAVAIAVTIRDAANTTLVSETVAGSFLYSGSAFQAPVGSEWQSLITFSTVPEPATWSFFCCGLAVWKLGRLRNSRLR